MDLQGKLLKSVELNGKLQADFGAYAQQKLVDGLEPMVGGLISDYWDIIQKVVDENLGSLGSMIKFPDSPEKLTDMLMECLGEDAIKAYLTFSESNEDKKAVDALRQKLVTNGIDKLVEKLTGPLVSAIAKPIVHKKIDPIINPILGSLLGNITHNETDRANVTNDLDLSIKLPRVVANAVNGTTAAAAELKVNPTLTKGPVCIEVPALAEAAQLCIYDLNGRVVYRTEVPGGEATLLPYNFTHKGIYMVKIIGQGNAVKVIVE